VVVGQAVAYGTAYICFRLDHHSGWRWMLGLGAGPALLQFLLFLSLPESPRFLISLGEYNLPQARQVLMRLRGATEDSLVNEELNAIHQTVKADQQDNTSMCEVLSRMLSHPGVRNALCTGILLQVFQQLIGINAIMYYSSIIFEDLNSDVDPASDEGQELDLLYSLLVATVGMTASIASLWIVDNIGRRVLLLASTLISLLALVWVAIAFSISASPILTVLGICLYVMAFQCGLGPLPWTLNAEFYPLWARPVGTGISTVVNWIMTLVVSVSFLSMREVLGQNGVFAFYSGWAVLSGTFFYFRVPETKGHSLETLQYVFNRIAEKGYYQHHEEHLYNDANRVVASDDEDDVHTI